MISAPRPGRWRFDPVTVAGKPFPARVKLPITYMTGIPGGEQFVDHKQMLFLKKQKRKREALRTSGDARDLPLSMDQVASVEIPLQPDRIAEVQVRTAP